MKELTVIKDKDTFCESDFSRRIWRFLKFKRCRVKGYRIAYAFLCPFECFYGTGSLGFRNIKIYKNYT